MDALADTAGQREIHLTQLQHLHAVNQADIACSTGRADAIRRAGDAEGQRDFAGRVVGHGARVVMVRPIGQVKVVLRNLVDLVLCLHIAVFRRANVDAYARTVASGEINARVFQRVASAKDADGTSARAAPQFLALLVAQRIKVAHTCIGLAYMADRPLLHA